jgi:hypothetical protein
MDNAGFWRSLETRSGLVPRADWWPDVLSPANAIADVLRDLWLDKNLQRAQREPRRSVRVIRTEGDHRIDA